MLELESHNHVSPEEREEPQGDAQSEEHLQQEASDDEGFAEESLASEVDAEAKNQEASSFKSKYEELALQREKEKEQFLLFRADTENLRKRLNKEKTEALRYALEKVFLELLPCLDSFEQALNATQGKNQDSAAEADSVALLKGVQLVYKQLMDILARHGLKSIEALQQEFDPNIHQALRQEPSGEVTIEVVGEVYQNGYYFHERLLRPAVVSVLTPEGSSEANEESEEHA